MKSLKPLLMSGLVAAVLVPVLASAPAMAQSKAHGATPAASTTIKKHSRTASNKRLHRRLHSRKMHTSKMNTSKGMKTGGNTK